ncbi:lysosome-associated membrane glycoprotein 3 [Hippoglossus hippoglossus]|uniref:lysosome-associated membrane glycoprotein 3 n=1 Tax=Hippoglossus hippoglossus TaxID=8267 RepID=UPI00148D70FA|nr:lysosome-associated membrane glycoprotein 3 [Hippoglossus hippoglossus]
MGSSPPGCYDSWLPPPGVSSFSPAYDSEGQPQIALPVLQPTEATPPLGTYILKGLDGKTCIKATMGVEFIVIQKKTWYFSLDPSRIRTSGYCGKEVAVLSLTLPGNAASLQLTFKKENKVFYITKLTSHLSPLPVCPKCANKTFSGLLDHDKLFKSKNGNSFACKSENLLLMSSELQIKLVPLKFQAFTLTKGGYGKEVECWADYNKRVLPIIIGATVVGILLIAVLTFLFIKDRNRQGYEEL